MDVLKYFLTLQGLYPYILLISRGKPLLANVQASFSVLLIIVTSYNLFQDVKSLFTISQSEFGLGGPTVIYSLIAIDIFLHLINLVVRIICFVRISLSSEFLVTLRRHIDFCKRLRESASESVVFAPVPKGKYNTVIFIVTAAGELILISYVAITGPGPTQEAINGFYDVSNWLNISMHTLGVIFSYSFILDVATLASMIYMDFVTQSLSVIRSIIRDSVDLEQDAVDFGSSVELVASPKKKKKQFIKSGTDELEEFMLEDLRHCLSRLKGQGHIPSSANPVALYEELSELWSSTKDIWGLVFFLSISTCTIRLVSGTFHMISATIDLGSMFTGALYFYIICFLFWIKLTVFTNCAQEVQNQVDKLEELIVKIKYNLGFNQFLIKKRNVCSAVEIQKLEEHLRSHRFQADALRVFIVERKTVMNIVSIISNYMVVLLQFWMTSSKSKALAEA